MPSIASVEAALADHKPGVTLASYAAISADGAHALALFFRRSTHEYTVAFVNNDFAASAEWDCGHYFDNKPAARAYYAQRLAEMRDPALDVDPGAFFAANEPAQIGDAIAVTHEQTTDAALRAINAPTCDFKPKSMAALIAHFDTCSECRSIVQSSLFDDLDAQDRRAEMGR